jgi:membrane protein YdbS with pleckstrin-like domain
MPSDGGILLPMNEESTLWKGSSSQWLNLGNYILALVAAVAIAIGGIFFPLAFIALILPLLFAVWNYLVIRMRVFELSCERLRITSGVINQHIDEIELYRVKDTLVLRPWWMRLTGLASISLETSDRTLPKLVIPAIHDGWNMREILRKRVEIQRDKKRVREMDFDDVSDGDFS